MRDTPWDETKSGYDARACNLKSRCITLWKTRILVWHTGMFTVIYAVLTVPKNYTGIEFGGEACVMVTLTV